MQGAFFLAERLIGRHFWNTQYTTECGEIVNQGTF